LARSKPSPDGTYFYTSESVTMGHPDKIADQISDAVLDSLLAVDPNARVALETLVTTGLVVMAGEITVHNNKAVLVLDRAEETARETIQDIGYTDPEARFDFQSCGVMRAIHSQSADISQGVTAAGSKEQGAGDQGMMYGFACRETRALMPLPIHLAHRISEQLATVRQQGGIKWLRPDGKSQVTVEYCNGTPRRIDAVVVSTQHLDMKSLLDRSGNMNDKARKQIIDKVIRPMIMKHAPRLWNPHIKFHINPTGRFVIGGPYGDTGLTGRKIIVDTYGGRGRHGGGAFSGKDPSKVDRSAAYMARYVAKNVVAAGLADVCEIQLSYAIGVTEPISVHVTTEKTARVEEAKISKLVRDHFPLTPAGIIQHLKLKRPIYRETARHGHFGRTGPGFTWEKTDKAEALRKATGL
jgi:S-adenosylmethionine synthetase